MTTAQRNNGQKARIVITGASGHGKVCGEIAELTGYQEIYFLDDDIDITHCGAYQVKGTVDDFQNFVNSFTVFFVAIGNAGIRQKIQEEIEAAGGKMTKLIHPAAVISQETEIGNGTVIMAGTVINSGSIIGKGVIVNTCSSIDHDCIVGDYCHVAVGAHLCGTVHVGDRTWIGAGATVSNNVDICSDCVVGAGAVVTRNIMDAGTYVGIPAKNLFSIHK